MSDLASRFKALGLELVWQSPDRVVVWTSHGRKEFSEADPTKRNRIAAICRLWCEGHKLNSEQHNPNEGRAKKGSINKRIEAFKTHKVRLYGYQRTIFGINVFVAVGCDPQKKSDKAKPRVLNSVTDRIITFEEFLGGQNV